MRPVPLTLNEISHMTPTAPPHISNQPGVIHQIPPSTGSRRLTDVRQLNPFLPPPSAAPSVSQQTPIPGSRSARALQQFLQPRAAGPRQLPPAMNQIHPLTPHQVPRVPHQIAPRGFGGGGHSGGGGRRGGGGGGGRGR
jgi:hypothetical protein